MKTPNRQELQQIAINYSSDIEFGEFKRLYERYAAKPYSVNQMMLYIFERIYRKKYREQS